MQGDPVSKLHPSCWLLCVFTMHTCLLNTPDLGSLFAFVLFGARSEHFMRALTCGQ